MIIDNKRSYGSNPDVKTVWDCILPYTDPSARVGRMDVVTRMIHSNTQGFVEKDNCTIIHNRYIGKAKVTTKPWLYVLIPHDAVVRTKQFGFIISSL